MSKIKYKPSLVIVFLIFISGCSLFYPRHIVWYANDNGVDYETAKYRISIQREIGDLQSVIDQDKEHFAGLYIEHQPTYSINVLYKNKEKTPELDAFIAQKSWRKFVKVHQVSSSLDDLRSDLDETSEILDELNITHAASVMVSKSQVEIYVLDKQSLEQALFANKITLPGTVKIIQVSNLGEPE